MFVGNDGYLATATSRSPTVVTQGVTRLIINGRQVIRDGELVDSRAGQIVRKSPGRCDRD